MPERQPYLSELPDFIPLPSEPEDLTTAHALLLFTPAAADDFVRSVRIHAPAIPEQQHTPLPPRAREETALRHA